jgi:hypothetical protein
MTTRLAVPAILTLLLATAANAAPPDPRWTVEFEAGRVWSGRNTVQIPNDETSTRFSFTDDLTSDASWAFRGQVGYALSARSRLLALAAPLTVDATGTVDRDVSFEGETFAAGTDLEGTFHFNSYRLTWLYQAIEGPGFSLAVGLTAKVRDAYIELRGDGRTARKDDLGFVPLVGFDARLPLGGRFTAQLAGDALAAPQGRAEDVRLALRYQPTPDLGAFVGYRLLEGGADNDTVYTFSLFHYATAGVSLGF